MLQPDEVAQIGSFVVVIACTGTCMCMNESVMTSLSYLYTL